MSITFTEYGAAESIDGSKGILQVGDTKYLIDCGKDYGSSGDSIKWPPIPFDAKSISNTFITHAHGDHMGELLEFVSQGFAGKIFSTYQTAEIAKQQLTQETSTYAVDSYNNKIRGKRFQDGPHKGEFIPFKRNKFKYSDVAKVMGLFASDREEKGGFAYHKPITIDDKITASFFDAGHIPGSAQILFEMHHDGCDTTLLTACDLGRTDYHIKGHPIADIPIVRAPEKDFPKPIDHVILEATYGAKVHRPFEESLQKVYDTIWETANKSGVLIIPAFSIMRTHMISVILYDLYKSGKLPEGMGFYISSPNADQVSRTIMHHPEDMDDITKDKFSIKKDNPFWFDRLVHHKKYAETEAVLNSNQRPYAIIAASGMCDMGRIVPILKRTISDPNTTVALLGYQAEGTKGRKILDKAPQIWFDDEVVPLKANVVNISGFSGHADCMESLAHLQYINSRHPEHPIKTINIKHGEKEQCYALASRLSEAGFSSDQIHVLKKGQTVTLDS